MKKFLISLFLIIVTGCSISANATPKQKVEEFLNKYKMEHTNVIDQLKDTIESAFDNDDYKERYNTLMLNQYKSMEYKITDEIVEENTAVVEVEVTVLNYGSAITNADDYLSTHADEFQNDKKELDNDSFQDYKLSLMEKVTDTVDYKIEFNLTKNDKGEWEIDSLSDTDLEKLHGIYVE